MCTFTLAVSVILCIAHATSQLTSAYNKEIHLHPGPNPTKHILSPSPFSETLKQVFKPRWLKRDVSTCLTLCTCFAELRPQNDYSYLPVLYQIEDWIDQPLKLNEIRRVCSFRHHIGKLIIMHIPLILTASPSLLLSHWHSKQFL